MLRYKVLNRKPEKNGFKPSQSAHTFFRALLLHTLTLSFACEDNCVTQSPVRANMIYSMHYLKSNSLRWEDISYLALGRTVPDMGSTDRLDAYPSVWQDDSLNEKVNGMFSSFTNCTVSFAGWPETAKHDTKIYFKVNRLQLVATTQQCNTSREFFFFSFLTQ